MYTLGKQGGLLWKVQTSQKQDGAQKQLQKKKELQGVSVLSTRSFKADWKNNSQR